MSVPDPGVLPGLTSVLPSETRDRSVLLAAALAYVPLVFLGYGADNDSYLVVETGVRIVEGASYVPSRQPGYLLHEATTGVLSLVGGPVATNLATLAAALLALAAFLALCRRIQAPHRHLLAITFAFHPIVWANTASTMDYLWGLGFGLAGGVALLDRRWVGAGLLFALAIGARFTSALFIAAFFAFVLWRDSPPRREAPPWRGLVLAATLTLVLGVLWYVPTILHYSGTLDFLKPAGAEEQALWSWIEYAGRFGYKNVYFWGLPAAALLAVLVALVVKRWSQARAAGHGPLLIFAATVVLGYELLFLRYPLEQEYLLPIVPFVLIGLSFVISRRGLVAFAVLVLSYNVVSLNLARPDRPNKAEAVEIGVWVEPGYLVRDIAQRLRVRPCETHDCWMERSKKGAFPDLFVRRAD